jgi:hypothetical protein
VAERRSGRPFSYTFGAGTSVFGDPRQASRQRALFYVPTGPTDVIYQALCTSADVGPDPLNPVVAGCTSTAVYTSLNAAAAAFGVATEEFIESEGLGRYRGKIVPRNSGRSPWVTTVDMRLAQEIPIFRKTRAVVSLDIENIANLVNNDWGQISQVSFIYVSPVLDVGGIDAATNRYIYRPRAGSTGPTAPINSLTALNSVWRIQLGLRFEF